MRVDCHTHAFHPKIAAKVCDHLEAHYGLPPLGNGTIEDLLARSAAAGVEHVVVLCAATVPSQMEPANDWALFLETTYPEVTTFGTVHPYAQGWERELERLRAAGIKGLKFHPEFQGYWMNDPALYTVLEACQDFIWMFHVGDVPPPVANPSCPLKLAAILDAFPQARVIAAHLGGYRHWDAVLEHLAGRDVWMDTSSALPFIDQATLETIIARHDPARLLFGSDAPLFDAAHEIALLQKRLGFGEARLQQLDANAAALLGW